MSITEKGRSNMKASKLIRSWKVAGRDVSLSDESGAGAANPADMMTLDESLLDEVGGAGGGTVGSRCPTGCLACQK
jgi:hypothetical protein